MKTLLFVLPFLLFAHRKKTEVISCATIKADYQFKTVKAGNWSDPLTWNLKRLPSTSDSVEINHTLTLDTSVTISGAKVNSTFKYKTTKNVTLSSTKNLVIAGLFQMKPSSAKYNHTLRFVGINHNSYQPFTTHDVLPSNVGLWVTGSGKLDLQGTKKTPWVRLKGSAVKGESSSVLQVTPSGWKANDSLAIMPTEKTEVDILGYDDVLLKYQSGATVSFNKPLNHNHRIQNGKWTAEVLNLSRNVSIQGGHIVIMSKVPQSIRYVSLEAMGARKDINRDGFTEPIRGVYAIHFHHSMKGSIGSIIEGNVASNGLNHSFVPHNSTGVKFINNIAYNNFETAFWQDFEVNTDSILLDRNVVAKPKYVPKAINTDKGSGDDDSYAYGVSNFFLGLGLGNVAKGNVSVGQLGDEGTYAAYAWEANNEGVWVFDNNVAHNTYTGARIWQTSANLHTVTNFVTYSAIVGVFLGAYANAYQFIGGELYECPFIEKANSQFPGIRIEKMKLHDLTFLPAALTGEVPIQVKDCIITGKIVYDGRNEDQNVQTGQTFYTLKKIDFINSTLTNPILLGSSVAPGEVIRVQNGTTAYEITPTGKRNIPIFHK